MKISNLKLKITFLGIIILAAFFRLYGINWDQDHHLHPDERFLTMVSTSIKWPQSISEYFDTAKSTLNPHNMGYPFFVYGTFPIFFTKFIAESLGMGDYTNLTLIGRELSAFVDLGTVILVFLITKRSTINAFPLLAAFFYAASVLPIQLSHFYAVDTYLTFFLTLSFYLLIKIINSNPPAGGLTTYYLLLTTFLGISLGLAASSKISALLFIPIVALGLLIFLIKNRKTSLVFHCFIVSLFIVSFYITLRLAQPYLFQNPNFLDLTPNPKVLANLQQLKSFDNPDGGFPPAVQWISTKPYIFPLKNMIFWGLGLPMGIIAILSVLYLVFSILYLVLKKKIYQLLDTRYQILALSLLWILLLFIHHGSQFVKAMRYFIPLYPFIAILSAWFISNSLKFIQEKYKFKPFIVTLLHCLIVSLTILYPLSFLSIYSRPHSRITASEWIYQNIPGGNTIANEYWDDPLPLNLPTSDSSVYPGIMLPLYDQDTPEKWEKLAQELEKTDYIVLSSNRLYGSIMTVPSKYPITYRYYQSLFDGSLGFEKIAEFTSRPNLPISGINICLSPPFVRYGTIALKTQECPLPGLSFIDDYTDESFTVYDHPKVIIFKKIKQIDYASALLEK